VDSRELPTVLEQSQQFESFRTMPARSRLEERARDEPECASLQVHGGKKRHPQTGCKQSTKGKPAAINSRGSHHSATSAQKT
jgi:hypothetical protein